MDAAMVKLFPCEMAACVTRKAIQIRGGNGYSREYPVERMYRHALSRDLREEERNPAAGNDWLGLEIMLNQSRRKRG